MAAGVPSPALADMNAASWVQGFANNSANYASLLTPAAATQNRKIGLSDWISVQSVPRNDGGTARLIAVRATLTACKLGMLNNNSGSQDFTNWTMHPSGRIVRWRQQALSGGGVPANAGSWTSTVNVSGKSSLVGIRYMTKGKVINVAGFGAASPRGRAPISGKASAFRPASN